MNKLFCILVLLAFLAFPVFAYNAGTGKYDCWWGLATSTMTGLDGNSLAVGDSFILVDATNKVVSVFQVEDSSATADNVNIFSPTSNAGAHRWHKRVLGAKEYGITYASTIDINWDNGDTQYVVLTGNPTINAPTNPVNGKKYLLRLIQDSSGNRTATFDSNWIKWVGNNTPTQTSTGDRQDIISLLYSNGTYFGDMICNFNSTN